MSTQQTIDLEGLQAVIAESNELSQKPSLSKAEERRLNWCLATASVLKQTGLTLEDINFQDLQNRRRAAGLPSVAHKTTAEERALSRWIREGVVIVNGEEQRSESVGHSTAPFLNANMGSFVPIKFFESIKLSMANHSPLFDKDSGVTYLDSDATDGAVLSLPFAADAPESVATPISENVADTSDTGIFEVGLSNNIMVTFRSPRILFSYETFEDVPGWMDLLAKVLADRAARGISKKLVAGFGTQIEGLIPAINRIGSIIFAVGNSSNTGQGGTSANSVGSIDLANLYTSVPQPYRDAPSFAFLMNSTTLYALLSLLDKYGNPVININSGKPMLWGKRILIDDNLASPGLGNLPVIALDLSYVVTRLSSPMSMRLQRYTQTPGLVESGQFAMRLFVRASGAVTYSDTSANSPIWALMNANS